MERTGNRAFDAARDMKIEPGYASHGASVIFHMGNTIVHCSASLEEGTPRFVEEGCGWVTAEYSLMPSSTQTRARRERSKVGGRTMEIQRLIGRSLRSIIRFDQLGERTITLDCDVLRADGGTRCASISGAYIALEIVLRQLEQNGLLRVEDVLRSEVAAISLGIVEGQTLLDLEYIEDSQADVDLNLIMTGSGKLIEVQGTAEKDPFSFEALNEMLALGQKGIQEILSVGRAFLDSYEIPKRDMGVRDE